MKNLAGRPECDVHIRSELSIAGIPAESVEYRNTEVPYTVIGKLGAFTFRRAWYYWTVSGPMPLAEAEKMYADPAGVNDVRVVGHCGCPPAEWQRNGFVESYHIDTQEGLNLFAATVRSLSEVPDAS